MSFWWILVKFQFSYLIHDTSLSGRGGYKEVTAIVSHVEQLYRFLTFTEPDNDAQIYLKIIPNATRSWMHCHGSLGHAVASEVDLKQKIFDGEFFLPFRWLIETSHSARKCLRAGDGGTDVEYQIKRWFRGNFNCSLEGFCLFMWARDVEYLEVKSPRLVTEASVRCKLGCLVDLRFNFGSDVDDIGFPGGSKRQMSWRRPLITSKKVRVWILRAPNYLRCFKMLHDPFVAVAQELLTP